jgi:hypothetical protein
MLARNFIEPVIPLFDVVTDIIGTGDIDHELVRGGIAHLALNENWLPVYILSQITNREVSILIDADDKVWVDWGSQSEVKLHPPAGSSIPFKMWIHTHPRGDAYWSDTDKTSIASVGTILQRALVLGNSGILFTSYNDDELVPKCSNTGPLSHWSEEDVRPWFDVLVSSKGVNN